MISYMSLAVVTRTFQAGKNIEDFDLGFFRERVEAPIKKILKLDAIDGPVIVMINGDKNSKLGEVEINGELPSEHYLKQSFETEILAGRVIIKRCENWGINPGSAIALNEGDTIANNLGYKFVFHWSPEIDLNNGSNEHNHLLHKAMDDLHEKNLSVIGLARQNWWEKPQWAIPQNTASIWRLDRLMAVCGFDQKCNSFGTEKDEKIIRMARIEIGDETISEIPIAGMEDFHAMLRQMKVFEDFRWGIIKEKPLVWNTKFPEGSDRLRNHLIKVFRQYCVMKKYVEAVFPEKKFDDVMDDFWSKVSIPY